MADLEPGAGNLLWLASYPKSGNTWMRMLLANYFGEEDEPHDINTPGVTNGIASTRLFFDYVHGLDSTVLTDDEVQNLRPFVYDFMSSEATDLVWMKVHDAQQQVSDQVMLFPASASRGAVYILRNPLDVAVSMAFHSGHEDFEKSSKQICRHGHSVGGSADSQLRQYLHSWTEHVISWTVQSDIPILIVRYEDMLEDPARELRGVLKFARPDHDIEEDRLRMSVENASFENLQKAEKESGFRETTKRQKQFFRSGIAGDWKSKLTGEQVDRIRQGNEEMMAKFGYA